MDSTLLTKTHSNFNSLLTWFLSEKSMYIEIEEPWNISLFSQIISQSYISLPNQNQELKKFDITIDLLTNEELLEADSTYLKPVIELKAFADEHLSEFVHDFLIHGSIATMDYSKGWSDLDTYVILKSTTIEDHEKLLTFRKRIIEATRYLYEIDPLQHHGFIFCTEVGLSQYYSHFLPIEVLLQSKSIIRKNTLGLLYKRTRGEILNAFRQKNHILALANENKLLRHHKYNGSYLVENFENDDAMYQLKYFLSILMTLPAYYLDAKGSPCYKSDSFKIVENDFPKYWEIIEKATEIRNLWAKKESHPYRGNLIPAWVKEILGYEYFERAYNLSSEMLNSLEETKIKKL